MIKQSPKTLIETLVQEAAKQEDILNESVKEGIRYKFGAKEMEFGSPEHLKILKGLLHGLQSLRDCYQLGSAHRHVYALACHKLKKLILKHGPTQ